MKFYMKDDNNVETEIDFKVLNIQSDEDIIVLKAPLKELPQDQVKRTNDNLAKLFQNNHTIIIDNDCDIDIIKTN